MKLVLAVMAMGAGPIKIITLPGMVNLQNAVNFKKNAFLKIECDISHYLHQTAQEAMEASWQEEIHLMLDKEYPKFHAEWEEKS